MASPTPGTLGLDWSGARPASSDVYRNGARLVTRYSAGVGNTQPATQWKLCRKGEIADHIKAGLDFLANSEWYESRITEGAAAGLADGKADLAFWRSRGYAKGAGIAVSWDADPVRSRWDAAVAYLRAYGQGLGGYYVVGAYAGTPFLRYALSKGVIVFGWRPNAGSWSNDGLPYQPSTRTAAERSALVARAVAATPAHLLQTGNYWYSKGADENLVLRSGLPTHRAALAAAQSGPKHGTAGQSKAITIKAAGALAAALATATGLTVAQVGGGSVTVTPAGVTPPAVTRTVTKPVPGPTVTRTVTKTVPAPTPSTITCPARCVVTVTK